MPGMNYYKHHIGDYDAATAHLSWCEDMAYSRLLRLYYRTEQAIPADLGKACRLIRASSKAERQAVETVLGEFFALEDDGWHQKRCDEELKLATEAAERNRRNGTHGGRPPKPKQNPEETHSVISGNPNETLATSHKPIASSHDANASSTREGSDERSHANGLEPSDRDLSAKAGTRGTRCPADWRPDPPNCERCVAIGLDLESQIIEFRNYWRAIPGSKGLKLDWDATFYNRCSEVAGRRNGLASQGRGRLGNSPVSITQTVFEAIAADRKREL
jgi:uncharacterized protein YdaU (DUF1376 family)